MTLDIAKPEGQAIARRLAARCDVLIENYKAGDLARYGLGYEQLRELNPGLIYCSITGFGQTGPMRNVAGYDFIIQAMGGLMSITGERDDLPGGGPQKVGVAVADITTGHVLRPWRSWPRSRTVRRAAKVSTSTWRCSTCRSR